MLELAKHIPPLLFENRLTEVTFFSTDICNMKCRHCFVHEALNEGRKPLTLDEIHKMSPHIPAMQRVHLGGGEPFTRADIGELATIVSNDWKAGVVCIPTNGWFTDRVTAAMRHFGDNAKGNLRIHFSINSDVPSEMDEFTQLKGSFERWKVSIAAALQVSKQYENITIVALATFNEFNQHKFKNLIDFVHDEIGVEDFSFHLVRTHGEYAPQLDMGKFREANDYYFSKFNRQNPVLSAFRREIRDLNADYYEDPTFKRRCRSGKIRVVMSPEGDVYPCEKLGYPNLRDMRKWLMGNVRDFDYDINALVRSTKSKELYGTIVCAKCHCDHNIDQSLSDLSSSAFKNRVLGNAAKNVAGRLLDGQGAG